jgi:Na+/phosphate symporter
MNGIVKYFDNYTDPTNDPAALSSDATSTATTGIAQAQRETAALGDTAMDLRPTALHTNGDSIAASPAASTAALSSDATSTATTGIAQAQRETAALGDTAMDLRPGGRGAGGRNT